MTIGDGILWSTVLILLAAGIYLLSIKKKWKTFGKVLGVIVLIGAVIGTAVWGYYKYEDRPQMTMKLGEIGLDMAPVEVTLKLGEADVNFDAELRDETDPESGYSMLWLYSGDYDDDISVDDISLVVRFYGPDPDSLTTVVICQYDGIEDVVGVGRFESEERVIERLGEPTNVSINEEGTSKYISYEQWSAAYQIEKGKVSGVCLTGSGSLEYGVEYGEETDSESPENP